MLQGGDLWTKLEEAKRDTGECESVILAGVTILD